MKNVFKVFGLITFVAVIGFSIVACDNDSGTTEPIDLSGDITISSTTVTVGAVLTAKYDGKETVSYQWNKDGTAINGQTTVTITADTAGSYTVTVSASGYNSKTSEAVVVNPVVVPEFNQQVALSGNNLVGETLTANITGTGGVGTPTVKINGVNGASYVIGFGDVGQKLEAEAVWENGKATGAMANAVATPTIDVELTESETDDDKLYVGETLTMTATVGNVKTGLNPGVTYAWKAGTEAIANADGTTLVVTDAFAGKTITGTASLTEYPNAKKDTQPTPAVQTERSTTITGLLDNGATATVKGKLTSAEWGSGDTSVAEIIKTAINAKFAPRPDSSKAVYRTVFGRGVTIIVEASPEDYTNWKTVGDGKTVYLSLAATNATTLDSVLNAIIGTSLSGNASTIAVIQPKHDNGWRWSA
jgi:hypothetical protein